MEQCNSQVRLITSAHIGGAKMGTLGLLLRKCIGKLWMNAFRKVFKPIFKILTQ